MYADIVFNNEDESNSELTNYNGNGNDSSGLSDDVELYDLVEQQEREIRKHTAPALLIIGTVGNVVSLVVLRRLSIDVMSTCLYLTVLCVTDLLVLYTRCGDEWLSIVFEKDGSYIAALQTRSDMVCKSLPFICGSIYFLSRWMMTATAIEGVIACRYPHSVPTRCTRTKAKAIIMLTTALVVSVNLNYFWSFDLVQVAPEEYACTFTKNEHRQSVYFQETVLPVLNNAVTDLVPSAIILPCTVTMAISLATGRHRGSDAYRKWRERYLLEPDGVERLVWLYLAVSVMFVCLVVPKTVVELSRYVLTVDSWPVYTNILSSEAEYCWFSLKLIVYILSSSRFRDELSRTACRVFPVRQAIILH